MKNACLAIALIAGLTLAAFPAQAQTRGATTADGYYWLKDRRGRYQCRHINDRRILPHKKCLDAGAVKP